MGASSSVKRRSARERTRGSSAEYDAPMTRSSLGGAALTVFAFACSSSDGGTGPAASGGTSGAGQSSAAGTGGSAATGGKAGATASGGSGSAGKSGAPASGGASGGGAGAAGKGGAGGGAGAAGKAGGAGAAGKAGAAGTAGKASGGGAGGAAGASAGGSAGALQGGASGSGGGATKTPLDCDATPTPGALTRCWSNDGVAKRAYYLLLNNANAATKPQIVTFVWHGCGMSVDDIRSTLHLEGPATGEDAVFVYPIAQPFTCGGDKDCVDGGACNGGTCAYFPDHTMPENAGGVGFKGCFQEARGLGLFEAVVSELAKAYVVDESQVFSTGYSSGGIMSDYLGCKSTTVKAIASIEGNLGAATGACPNAIDAFVIHHPKDMVVPWATGVAAVTQLAKNDGCTSPDPASFTGTVEPPVDFVCAGGRRLRFWGHTYYDWWANPNPSYHWFPDNKSCGTNAGVPCVVGDAASRIWKFFRKTGLEPLTKPERAPTRRSEPRPSLPRPTATNGFPLPPQTPGVPGVPPPHVCGTMHVPHWRSPLQPSAAGPQFTPSPAQVFGVQGGAPHCPGFPPPPHVWPAGQLPQSISTPQPLPAGPQPMFCCAHVSGVHI